MLFLWILQLPPIWASCLQSQLFPIHPPLCITKMTFKKQTWSWYSYTENSLVESYIFHNKKTKSISNAFTALYDLAPIWFSRFDPFAAYLHLQTAFASLKLGFFFLFRAMPAAYGSFQLGVQTELHLWSTSQFTLTQILNPLNKARDRTHILMHTSRVGYTEPQWELPWNFLIHQILFFIINQHPFLPSPHNRALQMELLLWLRVSPHFSSFLPQPI